ncbi:MAG: hypothetical protein D6767_01540 [Candidatus Hydrogenedentota bacterium]|nr:MAG: hypothetical protein D6767_01540 [Candidatus Hydrogenedentota bacterium]
MNDFLTPHIELQSEKKVLLLEGNSQPLLWKNPISISDWNYILKFWPKDEMEIAKILSSIEDQLTQESKDNFLLAYKHKKGNKIWDDLLKLRTLNKPFSSFYQEKKIPLYLLNQLKHWPQDEVDILSKIFLNPEIPLKNNLVREWITRMVDLDSTDRKNCLNEILQKCKKALAEKNYRVYLPDHIEEIVFRYRYPLFAQKRQEISPLLREVRKAVQPAEVSIHPFLEDKKIRFSFLCESLQEYNEITEKFINAATQDSIAKLIQALQW